LQRYPAVYKGLALARWLQHLEALRVRLEAWPATVAYPFDLGQVPQLLDETG